MQQSIEILQNTSLVEWLNSLDAIAWNHFNATQFIGQLNLTFRRVRSITVCKSIEYCISEIITNTWHFGWDVYPYNRIGIIFGHIFLFKFYHAAACRPKYYGFLFIQIHTRCYIRYRSQIVVLRFWQYLSFLDLFHQWLNHNWVLLVCWCAENETKQNKMWRIVCCARWFVCVFFLFIRVVVFFFQNRKLYARQAEKRIKT